MFMKFLACCPGLCLSLGVSVAVPSGTYAQVNLVPNPSFEDYTACPPGMAYVNYATGWHNFYTFSADYFNECATSSLVDVPGSSFAFQAADDGVAYMGCATLHYPDTNYREAIAALLTQPLQPGIPVYMAMRVCAAGDSNYPIDFNNARYVSSGIGMRFVNSLEPSYWDYIDSFFDKPPALFLDSLLSDTINWQTLSGSYTPDSAYTYITIGNFLRDQYMDTAIVNPDGLNAAYALVDKVCVSLDPFYCLQYMGIANPEQLISAVSPNPFSDRLDLELARSPSGFVRIQLFDNTGREMFAKDVTTASRRLTIWTPALPDGAYLLRITDGSFIHRTIPIIHLTP